MTLAATYAIMLFFSTHFMCFTSRNVPAFCYTIGQFLSFSSLKFFFHVLSRQNKYESAPVKRWGDGPTFSLTLFQLPAGVTNNGLFIALRCTLLCGCECLFSKCITHMECISEPRTWRNCRSDVFSLANCVVKATNVNRTVCLEEEKHTFPGSGWCWEIKWSSAPL